MSSYEIFRSTVFLAIVGPPFKTDGWAITKHTQGALRVYFWQLWE